jgi:pimeloyl-ACP methyl ester carboxylesterase
MLEYSLPPARFQGTLPDGTACAVYGQGQPVVFVHGVGMNQTVWAPQVMAFARDHQVIVFDMLGHGRSVLPPEAPNLADYAEQLLRLLDALNLPAAHIVGHSMGALVSLAFALAHPERCLSVSALNAVFCRTPEQRAAVEARASTLADIGSQATIEATLARWFGHPVPAPFAAAAHLARQLLADVRPEGYARTYRLFATSDAAHATELARLRVPALFMTGERDPNSTPAMSAAMAALVPGARLSVLTGERHMMCLTAPAQVHAELHPFLLAHALRQPTTQEAA